MTKSDKKVLLYGGKKVKTVTVKVLNSCSDYYKSILEVKKMDCIFCKIANGEIPSATLYEDEDFRVMLDIGPASFGHTLILPKKHYANIYELPEELAAKVFVLAKKTANALKTALDLEGLNVVQNNGSLAGQTVFHFHMHLIPRYQGDEVGLTWRPGELTEHDRDKILKKVDSLL